MRVCFLCALLIVSCNQSAAEPFYSFGHIAISSRLQWVVSDGACDCELSPGGQIGLQLHFSGKYLTGQVQITPGAPLHRACLAVDGRLAIQKASWGELRPCAGMPRGVTAWQLPSLQVEKLQFTFALREEARDAATPWVGYVFPLLFAVDCPSACRRPPVSWPVSVSLRLPPGWQARNASAGGEVAGEAGGVLRWQEPYPRLALVLHAEGYVPARLNVQAEFTAFSMESQTSVLPRLHAFAALPEAASTGRSVVLDPRMPFPWGIGLWRFAAGAAGEEVEAEISASWPMWMHAPPEARAGAVKACALARLSLEQQNVARKALHKRYLEWVEKRAADPAAGALAPPTAYWALLFAGVLQRSAEGLQPKDCAMLSGKGLVSFHEILALLGGRIPRRVLWDPPAPSVRLHSLVPQKDGVCVKLFNDSEISFWVPVQYRSSTTTGNHWVFVEGKSGVQEVVLQQTGKPVDFLVDPDRLSLALPFGWTRDGPPEDLDGPPNVAPDESLE